MSPKEFSAVFRQMMMEDGVTFAEMVRRGVSVGTLQRARTSGNLTLKQADKCFTALGYKAVITLVDVEDDLKEQDC